MSDEFTARELGLLAGSKWAALAGEEEVKAVADTGEVPATVKALTMQAGIADRLVEYADENAEEAFWQGFVHGVRAHIVQALDDAARRN